MNSKELIFTLCMMCGFNAFSQENYFAEGTSWIVRTDYIDSKGQSQTSVSELWIEGTTPINGLTYMNLWQQDYDLSQNERIGEEKTLCSFIYADSNKIYTFNYGFGSKPFLLYDFDLTPGENCSPYCGDMLTLRRLHFYQPSTYPLSCVREETLNYGNTTFKALFVRDLSDSFSQGEEEFDAVWIKGIGSANGPLDNCRYRVAGDASSRLIKVTSNGTIVYEYDAKQLNAVAGILEQTPQPDDATYTLSGRRTASSDTGILIHNKVKTLK